MSCIYSKFLCLGVPGEFMISETGLLIFAVAAQKWPKCIRSLLKEVYRNVVCGEHGI